MIMSDDVVYRNLKVYKTLVARLLKKFRFEKKIKRNSKESVYFKNSNLNRNQAYLLSNISLFLIIVWFWDWDCILNRGN